ncbi:MAG: hypothetical protein RL071_4015, partial [Pseudomonadota bacterium]
MRVVIRHPSPALAQALEAQLHAQDAQLRIVQVDPGAPHSPAALTLATAAPPPTSADCGVWVTLDPDGPLPDPAALTAAVTAARARARSLGGLLPTHRLLGALRQIV